MGKHDMGTPINETLEKHYQETIKTLNEKLDTSRDTIDGLRREIERLKTLLGMKNAQIEVLLEKLVER